MQYTANKFLRSADGGKTWRIDSVDISGLYGLCDISAIDENTCYSALFNATVGLGGGIYKTTDGGDTWKQLAPGKLYGATSFLDIVHFFDAQHGVTIGDDGTDTSRLEIYTTSNAGKTWERVLKNNLPTTEGYAYTSNFNSYSFFQNTIWFAAADSYGNSYIYRSDDFGQHWKQFPNFPYSLGNYFDFAFVDKQHGLGVTFDYGVGPHEIETHDGGKTWNNKSFTGYPMGLFITNIPFTHTYISSIPYSLTPVAGTSYSNDYGATWKLIDTSANLSHTAASFLNPLVGWSGRDDSQEDGSQGPNGGIYKWKLQFSLDDNAIADNAASTDDATVTMKTNTTLKLYPNPAKDVVRIDGLNALAKTTLSLFNISGKLIQQSTSNSESYQFNIHNLSAGSYYIKAQSDDRMETLKFIKE